MLCLMIGFPLSAPLLKGMKMSPLMETLGPICCLINESNWPSMKMTLWRLMMNGSLKWNDWRSTKRLLPESKEDCLLLPHLKKGLQLNKALLLS